MKLIITGGSWGERVLVYPEDLDEQASETATLCGEGQTSGSLIEDSIEVDTETASPDEVFELCSAYHSAPMGDDIRDAINAAIRRHGLRQDELPRIGKYAGGMLA